jgi:signal transduction histidine kinase
MSTLAIALFFWAYPLWRDIRALASLTDTLGEGSMESRLQLPRRSALYALSQQFNAMAERIQQLINGHRDLTNAVSHELRTPLARMRFGLEMLEQNASTGKNQRYMKGLYQDIDELEELVGQLLTYARFERNAPMGKQESIVLIP